MPRDGTELVSNLGTVVVVRQQLYFLQSSTQLLVNW